ncbi:MAG TPA: flagellar hook-associated protein FlgK [Bacillota bacterium]|nr:flagellar hook-associated protein FlgK [Bacillota bacterium]HOL10353.1 flagellar hook-associated protein FlgK [Bacillota bacterium]HPO97359.1 flagellar hook-associated protein FlgK [Bacillota bacterium]
MRSTFGSLETGLRALRTNQLALQVTGHNISNADTPGYSRQVPVINPTPPFTYPALNRHAGPGQIGTGVEVSSIMRMREAFLDYQIQNETSSKGQWEARQYILEHLEVIFNEPSDSGISARLTQFWDSLHELAFRPDDSSVRAALREDAIVFTDTLRHTYSQLTDLQADIDKSVINLVDKVNTLAQQIADYNVIICKVIGANQDPNDLLDQRERLVEELSQLVKVNVTNDAFGRYNISVGGGILVAGDSISPLMTERNLDNGRMVDVIWQVTGKEVNLTGGKIKGFLEMRDEELSYYIDSLNTLAATLITRFNEVHAEGFGLKDSTSVPFFKGYNAETIDISTEIAMALDTIAASIDVAIPPEFPHGAPGNGDNALRLTKIISQELLFGNGTMTLSQFYNGIIAKLGIDAEKANSTLKNQESLVNYLHDRQESIAGVSIDEEMTNLIKYQNAYNASSRYITTIDEILDTLIKSTGVVGR